MSKELEFLHKRYAAIQTLDPEIVSQWLYYHPRCPVCSEFLISSELVYTPHNVYDKKVCPNACRNSAVLLRK